MACNEIMSLALFAFAMSATPGPNTMMQLASGVNFGVRATIPHMLGVLFGFALLLLLVGLGLGALILADPAMSYGLKAASIVYMLWLAWGIARAGGPRDVEGRGRPMSFTEAALFQWINPKAWAIALTSVSGYTVAERYAESLMIVILVFSALNLPISAAWTAFGVALRRLLHGPRQVRVFNVTMALLLVGSLYPLAADVISQWHVNRG